MKAHEITSKAAELVAGDRDRVHGAKAKNFSDIAGLWNAYLQAEFGTVGAQVRLRGKHVAALMALMKIARTCTGAHNVDDYIDAAGYAGCAGELAEADAAVADRINMEKLPVAPYRAA